ncbi:MAG: response regulator, partial [Pseudomonas sp.]
MSVISKSILLVDDDEEIRELLQTYLSRAGFQVRGVPNGAGFRQAMDAAPCDLVILDVMLPGRDGWQILQAVRSAGMDIPVLFLTARDAVEDRVHGLELGADDYLVKPFAFSELL